MIIGAHSVIFSANPDADRTFLRDVIGLTGVDVGGGWLIFGLPPAEVAVHPSDADGRHELYLMCDDIESLVAHMNESGIASSPVQHENWGSITYLTMPGGGKLGVYEPSHARPDPMGAGAE
jgi:hypothetical protein